MTLSSTSRYTIGFYLHNLGSGGIQRTTVALANGLARRGHQVHLIIERGDDEIECGLSDTISVHVLARAPKLQTYLRLIRANPVDGVAEVVQRLRPGAYRIALARLSSLASYLDAIKPDALIAAIPLPVQAMWARDIAKAKPAVVATIHTSLSRRLRLDSRDGTADTIRWRYYTRLLVRRQKRVSRFVAVSDGAGADFSSASTIAPERLTTIYNPLIPESIDELMRAPIAHPWFADTHKTRPLFVAIGRLVRVKGFDLLLEAFAHLCKVMDARLGIFGEGPERSSLEIQRTQLGLDQSVALPGEVSNPFAYLARSDVFVLSSRSEALPGALIEAMACGCRVVATDCQSGPSEILSRGELAPLVPIENPRALADAMKVCLVESDPSDALRQRAQDFSLARSVNGYERLLEAVCSSSPRPDHQSIDP